MLLYFANHLLFCVFEIKWIMEIRRFLFFTLVFFTILFQSYSQPKKEAVSVLVSPSSPGWIFSVGQRADFIVSVLKNGQSLSDLELTYSIGPEKMPVEKKGKLDSKRKGVRIKGITYDKPGFVRCKVEVQVDGKKYSGVGTAAFDPLKIKTVTKMPHDFDDHWAAAKEELQQIPMNPILTLMPELCTSKTNVYHLKLDNFPTTWQGNSHFYGMLSVPKKPGKYPALLAVPGAGVRPYGMNYRADKGIICLNVGIHGIPVNLGSEVYHALSKGALNDYAFNKLNNKDEYYYKRVYLGCIRAIDYIFSMEAFDGENLAVQGGSQGGALSIVTAGLDDRVKYLAAFFPALSDLAGYTQGRAGGWPHMFRDYIKKDNPAWIENASYYDVVNFARKLKIPGFYSWGYNDTVCPPTSMYAAYNEITAPKELFIFEETGHWTFPEQRELMDKWLYKMLKVE